MQAFILAGGFATRLWPLTEKRAKPLLPLAGRPLITHLLKKIPLEIPVTVSTNAAFLEGFEEWKTTVNRPHLQMMIEGSRSDDQKLGALGAIAEWITQESIDDDLLLLTGDNYIGFSIEHFLSRYHPGIPLVAAYDIQDPRKAMRFGTILTDPIDPVHVTGFEEKPSEPKTTLVSTGCSVLPRGDLPILVEYAADHSDNVGGIFEEFLRRKMRIECYRFTELWLDIGSFASFLEAHRLVVGNRTLLDPGATLTDSPCTGSVSIAAGSTVTKSRLTDCIVFENCIVDDCVLRNCVIDRDCRIQGVDLSDKMIRAGTVLEKR